MVKVAAGNRRGLGFQRADTVDEPASVQHNSQNDADTAEKHGENGREQIKARLTAHRERDAVKAVAEMEREDGVIPVVVRGGGRLSAAGEKADVAGDAPVDKQAHVRVSPAPLRDGSGVRAPDVVFLHVLGKLRHGFFAAARDALLTHIQVVYQRTAERADDERRDNTGEQPDKRRVKYLCAQ